MTMLDTQATTLPAADKAVADAHAALAQARRFTADLPVSPALVDLGRELKAAENEWAAQSDRTDEVKAEKEGREITDEDEAIWEAASSRHEDALERVLEYQPRSTVEIGYKARLLRAGSIDTRFRSDDEMGEVYLRDALALEGTAPSDPTWDRLVAEFETAHGAYMADKGTDAEEKLDQRSTAAENAVMNYPAPSLRALAYKMRQWIRFEIEDHVSDDIDDPRFVAAAMRLGCEGDRQLLGIYRDLLRFAGDRATVAYAKPFDAEAVLAAVDAAGHELVLEEDGFAVTPRLSNARGPVSAELKDLIDGLIQGELRVLRDLLQAKADEADAEPHLMAAE